MIALALLLQVAAPSQAPIDVARDFVKSGKCDSARVYASIVPDKTVAAFVLGACGPEQPAAPPAYVVGQMYDAQVARCADAEHKSSGVGLEFMQQLEAMCAAKKSEVLHTEVGSLISVGRCAEAIGLALRAGDIPFAAQVRSFCTAPPGK